MLGRVPPAVGVFIALPTLVLASCHLVGGTADLEIDPLFHEQGDGGDPAGGSGGAGGESTTPTTTTTGTGGSGGELCVSAECPGLRTDCLDIRCIDNTCTPDELPLGTDCDDDGGAYCDGGGNCVECTESAHCMQLQSDALCLDNACYLPGCQNGQPDLNETDVDCGDECPPCANNLTCVDDDDCQSLNCEGTTCRPCASSADCPAAHYCDTPFGDDECHPQLKNGELCTSSAQCTSGCCDLVLIFPICQDASECT